MLNNILIRKIDKSDLSTVVPLICKVSGWTEKDVDFFLTHQGGYHLGLFSEGVLTSYLLSFLVTDTVDIVSVGTDEVFRRRGFAKQLFLKLFSEPISKITLEVNIKNEAAIHLYLSLGFQIISTRKKYYQGEDDAFVMYYTPEARS